jgi:uncharacterized protein YndB with AHSA1/START domain
MEFMRSVAIAAPPERVFAVFSDVEKWPRWTPSVTWVRLLDPGPLHVGSRARIRQPRLPVALWTVIEIVADHYFVWEAKAPGVTTVGWHVVEGDTASGSVATSRLEQHGPVGFLLGSLTAGLTRRYLRQETDGLKAACEGPTQQEPRGRHNGH